MFWTRLLNTRWCKTSLSSSLVVVILISYPAPTLAINIWQDFLSFFGFQKRNLQKTADGRSKGGGGRGECSNLPLIDTKKQLTALIPPIEISPLPSSLNSSQSQTSKASSKSDPPSTKVWIKSYTFEEKPTFWFYLPYRYNEQSKLEVAQLAIIDEKKQLNKLTPIYFKLPEKSGIVQVRLPIGLEENKPYKWFFSVICDAKKPSRNPSVAGWIERVPRNKFPAFKPSNIILTRRYYTYYANYEFWYDAFTQLVQAYQLTKQQNQDLSSSNVGNEAKLIQEDWLTFFQVLKLSEQKEENDKIAREMADSPISTLVECVQKDNNQKCD